MQSCEKTSNKKQNIKEHMETHKKNNKTYPCAFCGKMYQTTNSLNVHMSFVHGSAPNKKCPPPDSQYFKCDDCDYVSNKKISLKVHM